MKHLLFLAACVAAASAWGQWNEGLSVRFDIGLFGAGRNFFIPIPQTLNEAKNSRWVETTRPAGPLPSLLMFCPSRDDVVICGLYDDNGNVAGLQIALPDDSWTDIPFDRTVQGFTQWTAPPNSSGMQRIYWTIQQYFVSEETLKKSKEERLASRVAGRVLQERAVWLTGINGELMRVSGYADEVTDTATTGFTEQACIPLMGRHFYYNMTAETPCTAESMFPWFPLVDRSANQLISSGLATFGKLPVSALVKDYFERPTRSNVQLIVPRGPECLYDLATDPGLVTMHIYYVNSPFLINCINY